MPVHLGPFKAQYWLEQLAASCVDPRERQLVQDCLERLSEVISGTSHSIIPRELPDDQLYTLLSNKWLSDEHINTCGLYLTRALGPDSPIRILSSYFVNDLQANRRSHQVWTPQKPRTLDGEVRSRSIRSLILPVHLPGHWALLVVDPLKRSYSYADTLDLTHRTAPVAFVDSLEWWLSSLFHTPYTLTCSPCDFWTGPQTDSFSCGVAVMTTVSHIVLSTGPWNQSQASILRVSWFLKLTTAQDPKTADQMLAEVPGSSPHTLTFGAVGDGTDKALGQSHTDTNGCNTPVPQADPTDSKKRKIHEGLFDPDSDSESSSESELGSTVKLSVSPAASRSHLSARATPKPLKQATLNFGKVTRDDWLVQERQRNLKRKEEDDNLLELERMVQEKKQLEKREKDRAKQQRKRARRKARKEQEVQLQTGNSVPSDGYAPTLASSETPTSGDNDYLSPGIAELSRPHRHSKVFMHSSTSSGHTYDSEAKAVRVNWTTPFLWSLIESAARAEGYPWSPAAITKRLKLRHPDLFASFRPQRISDYRDYSVVNSLKWKDSVLAAVKHGNHPGGDTVRQPILANYPALVTTFKGRLVGLRGTGNPLDLPTIRGFMIAMISEQAPELFELRLQKGIMFRCSDQFVRNFLHRELNWSLRRPTRAAQKVPANVEKVLTRAFIRLAYAVHVERVPSCCIVNSDQTQVVYSPGCQYTWHERGGKQVEVYGKEEKRAFTMLNGVSNDGELLPPQAIYQGSSAASLPRPTSPGYQEALQNNVHFVLSMTATYWSTLQTMKDYVSQILVPYFQHAILLHSLPSDQRCIWQIDVWSVHRSQEFRNWLGAEYPWIILQYIPGGCTGLFQACDVGLQRVAKAAIRQKALADIINETSTALQNGANPATFLNDKTIQTLRNRSVSWINEACKAMRRPGLIEKAFRLCAVPNTSYNLSYQSLTSQDARQAIRELRTRDPELHAETIAGKAMLLSPLDSKPEEETPTMADELSVNEHTQVLMSSETALEAVERLNSASDASESADSDDESIYEPRASTSDRSEEASTSSRPTRELPRRAAKVTANYRSLDWWNHVDLE